MGKLIVENSFIPQLNRERKIRIYLPGDYYENLEKRYPVLYMQDGQNVFEDITSYIGICWGAKEAMELLEVSDLSDGIIIVAIDHGGDYRISEYTNWLNEKVNKKIRRIMKFKQLPCEGDKYAQYIVDTLKPDIDNRYRTLWEPEYTGLLGSSCGANLCLYMAIKYSNIFNKIGILSPALWVEEEQITDFIRNSNIDISAKIYVSVGTNEGKDERKKNMSQIYVDSSKNIVRLLREKGFQDDKLKFVIEEGGIHNEASWSIRFPDFVKWAFG